MGPIYRRRAFAIPLGDLVSDFESTLQDYQCDAMISLPTQKVVRAGLDRAMGFAKCRGTAYLQVVNELVHFGLPPLLAEELFDSYTRKIEQRLTSLFHYRPGFTDTIWMPLDDNSVCVVERKYES